MVNTSLPQLNALAMLKVVYEKLQYELPPLWSGSRDSLSSRDSHLRRVAEDTAIRQTASHAFRHHLHAASQCHQQAKLW